MPTARCPDCDREYHVPWFSGGVTLSCDCGKTFRAALPRSIARRVAAMFRRGPRLPPKGTYRY